MPSWQSSLFDRFTRISRPPVQEALTGLDDVRHLYDNLTDHFGPVPGETIFEPATQGPVQGEWARRANSSPDRLVIFFHGGCFVTGTPQNHRSLVARLSQAAEAAVFTPAYRLAPQHVFPAPVRDGLDLYRQFVTRGIRPGSVVLAGCGSGGGLALSVLLAIRNAGLPMPAAAAVMSPWTDLSLSGWSMLKNAHHDSVLSWDMLFVAARTYLKQAAPSDPYASPVYAGFKGLPPLMVHAGSQEILRDDASRLGDKAAGAGVPVSVEIYDGMQHLFQANPYVPEAKVSLQRLGQFIRSRTKVIVPGVSGA